jgi:hypothetical protein
MLFFLGESGRGMKPIIQLPLVLKLKSVELYLHSPVGFHGVVINKAQRKL